MVDTAGLIGLRTLVYAALADLVKLPSPERLKWHAELVNRDSVVNIALKLKRDMERITVPIDAPKPSDAEGLRDWSLRMAAKEFGQEVGAGSFGIDDAPKLTTQADPAPAMAEIMSRLEHKEAASDAIEALDSLDDPAPSVAWRSQMPGDTAWLLTTHEPTPPGITKQPLITRADHDGIVAQKDLRIETLRATADLATARADEAKDRGDALAGVLQRTLDKLTSMIDDRLEEDYGATDIIRDARDLLNETDQVAPPKGFAP